MGKPLMLIEAALPAQKNVALDGIRQAVSNQNGNIRDITSLGKVSSLQLPNDGSVSSVDLIGHGAPGQISTGYTFTKVVTGTENGTFRYYLLDSDPYAYRALRKLTDAGVLSDTVP